jgi:hypothetical protein
MENNTKSQEKGITVKVDTGMGLIWFIGWLFTIAFARLDLVESLIALLGWPYYLGIALR